jgi:hypothetical protein
VATSCAYGDNVAKAFRPGYASQLFSSIKGVAFFIRSRIFPPLLGRFKSWSIDNEKRALILSDNPPEQPTGLSTSYSFKAASLALAGRQEEAQPIVQRLT